jgi:outer membrane protein OmpU
MKKVLLASTALVMTAGVAAAQGVELSGYAEIGIKGTEDNWGRTATVFHNDFDVKITLSGETDSGLTFGATMDLDELRGDSINPDGNLSSVFVSGNFGTLTMGDTDGALDWAMDDIVWGTAIADDHSSHAGWNGNSGLDGSLDGQVARYQYSFGDFAVALSAEIGSNTATTEENYGIGVTYATSLGGADIRVGLGYQDGTLATPAILTSNGTTTNSFVSGTGTGDIWGVSLSADLAGGFAVKLNYSKVDGNLTTITTATSTISGSSTSGTAAGTAAVEWDHVGIGLGYQMDALLIEVNYGKYDGTVAGVGNFEADGYGLAINYDLGGGAVAMFGYGSGDGFAAAGVAPISRDTWSAGLGLSF